MVNVHGAIEVWCELTQRWVEGFEVDDDTGTFRIRRTSDGAQLHHLPLDSIRPAATERSSP